MKETKNAPSNRNWILFHFIWLSRCRSKSVFTLCRKSMSRYRRVAWTTQDSVSSKQTINLVVLFRPILTQCNRIIRKSMTMHKVWLKRNPYSTNYTKVNQSAFRLTQLLAMSNAIIDHTWTLLFRSWPNKNMLTKWLITSVSTRRIARGLRKNNLTSNHNCSNMMTKDIKEICN